jgi:hypothetical protein
MDLVQRRSAIPRKDTSIIRTRERPGLNGGCGGLAHLPPGVDPADMPSHEMTALARRLNLVPDKATALVRERAEAWWLCLCLATPGAVPHFGLALLLMVPGYWWLDRLVHLWRPVGFRWFAGLSIALALYLLIKSWSTVNVLALLRHELLRRYSSMPGSQPPR